MATLAEQMRQENAAKFEAIKQELTDKVVNDIRNYGESKVNTYTDEKGISHHNIYGWYVNQAFRIPVKEHFKALGFVVIECTTPGGSHIGYQITL